MTNKPRFIQIDQTNLADHHYLTEDDECYFFFEWKAKEDFHRSKIRSIISNIKKPPNNPDAPGFHYKASDIKYCGSLIGAVTNTNPISETTYVPVPPSKAKGDALYDDRMLQICQRIPSKTPLDIRELVIQKKSMEAFHTNQANRKKPVELLENYEIDEGLAQPEPELIVIVDDMLTAGAHFRAMKTVLSQRFPNAEIVGFFIARRVPAEPDLSDSDIEFI